jgi:hypothetical protein
MHFSPLTSLSGLYLGSIDLKLSFSKVARIRWSDVMASSVVKARLKYATILVAMRTNAAIANRNRWERNLRFIGRGPNTMALRMEMDS